LAEELNFTQAASRLHITQSALSKQITELEKEHKFHLFVRTKKGIIELTDPGRIFVQKARSSLLHIERAVDLARTAQNGADNILMIGQSPDADPTWISGILAIHLPLYPKLRVRLISQFSTELVRSLMAGELDLALMTAPPDISQITIVPFSRTSLYAVLPESHPAADKDQVALQDLASDEWILFERRIHPVIHDAIMDTARLQRIAPKHAHDILTAQQAVHLVSEHAGVAFLTKPAAQGAHIPGVTIKALSDATLSFQTCVIMRADNESRLANEFVRFFLRRDSPGRLPPKQMELLLAPERSA
jgi:DNA-binding transcriptional LysR family regulator